MIENLEKSRLEKMNFIIQNHPELKYIFQENDSYSISLEVIKSNIYKYSPDDGKKIAKMDTWNEHMFYTRLLN